MKTKITRFSVTSVDDLVEKLDFIDLTSMVLSENEVEDFLGFKSMLDQFYTAVRTELCQVLPKIDS